MRDFLGSTSISASVTLLLIAAAATFVISLVAIALGFVIAAPVCAASLSRRTALRWSGAAYVSVFRGVPLLVQLMVLYYLLPFAGLELPSVVAGALALGICTAAYQAENLRGGFRIIPPGQAAAARAFGYSGWQTWRHVLLPQALRHALPAIVNEMTAILKASSLISVVGVAELTRVSENIVARSQQPIQWYGLAGLLYLAMNLLVSGAGRQVERGLRRGFVRIAL
jgi:polar amino acid transport system permease protein